VGLLAALGSSMSRPASLIARITLTCGKLLTMAWAAFLGFELFKAIALLL